MHRRQIRCTALLLVLCVLLGLMTFAAGDETPVLQDETQPFETETVFNGETEPEETVAPEEETQPIEEETLPIEEETQPSEEEEPLTDEALIETYSIPNTWARNALLFAARNGILVGTDDGTLSPEKNATRAEIATILSRILPTEHCTDLSAYTDMNSSKWYYEPMGQAAAMGLISGTGSTTMSPRTNATREQAFIMVARAFGLQKSSGISYSQKFKDWNQVSQWAAPYLATLVTKGYISGSNGYLKPKQNITRQEFAQILYGMIDRFSDTVPEQTDGMTVCTAQALPAGTVIEGSLLLCNDVTELSLENITVKGRLILQGADLLELSLDGCSIGQLVLCRPTNLQLTESKIPLVSVLDGKSSLLGTYNTVSASAETVLYGTAACVKVCEGDFAVAEGASADLLQAGPTADGSTVTVDGTVTLAAIEAELTLTGSGSVTSADIRAAGFSPEPVLADYSFTQDFGLSSLTGHGKMEGSVPKPGDATRALVMTFDGPYPLETCDVEWSVNGTFCWRDENVTLSSATALRHNFNFAPYLRNEAECTVLVEVIYRGRTERFKFKVSIRQSNLMYDVAQVRTLDIPATVKYTTNLYANNDLTGYLGSVPAGTTAIYKAYRETYSAKIQLPDGRSGWVSYSAIRISQGDYFTTKDYTPSVKEAWVNRNGYSSQTKYLIWCNLYTQRVNIFTGSQGNWKLVYSCQCASGANNTPTPQKVCKILYKSNKWNFGAYYVHHISVFDSTRGFHSMLYRYDSYTLYSTVMGRPASHGCVRVPDEGIYYIWNNVPVNSTVVIY